MLAKPARITAVISEELKALKTQYGDKRKSEIVEQAEDLQMEDLIAAEDVVVTFSHAGYIKSQPLTDYRAQRRGGRGKQAATTKEDDFIERVFIANTHDTMLCFSSRGRVYWLKVYNVPQGTRASRGKLISMLVADSENQTVLTATENGFGKRTPISDYTRHGRGTQGMIGIQTTERNGKLVGAVLVGDEDEIMLISTGGVLIRMRVKQIREMGRSTQGVRLIDLDEGTKLAGVERVAEKEEDEENGQQ